jgi:hypothetical protein
MMHLRKNRIANLPHNSAVLEAKVMLAASVPVPKKASPQPTRAPEAKPKVAKKNLSFVFNDNVPKSIRKASRQARQFWEPFITTDKKMKMYVTVVEIDGREKTYGDHTFGLFRDDAHSRIRVDKTDLAKSILQNPADQLNLLTHEVGHALGLPHLSNTVMNAIHTDSKVVTNKQLKILQAEGWRT